MIKSLIQLRPDHKKLNELSVYIVGGFVDDRSNSIELTTELFGKNAPNPSTHSIKC